MIAYGIIREARSSGGIEELVEVAKAEGVDYETLRRRVASGRVIVPRNLRGRARPIGIGEGLRAKVNVNVRAFLGQVQ